MKCTMCDGTGVVGRDGKTVSCQRCGMTIGRTGITVEGSSFWQVLIVAGGLVILVFALLVSWNLIFD